MKKQFLSIPFVLILSLFFIGCEKELSIENGGIPGVGTSAAEFSFDGGTGTCTGALISGTYKVGTATSAGNTVTLNVTVDSVGTYNIITATQNGISFSGAGTFTTTGTQSITLTASGTPTTEGDVNFTAGAGGCTFTVTILPNAGSSGGTAVYTFDGGSGSCTGALVNGTYTAGTVLGAGNTVQLGVNVTTAGTYTVSTTTENGISFSGTGTLATGNQTITLTGSGTPSAAGDFNYTAGAAGCVFSITVVPGSTSTTDFIRCKIDGVDKTFNDGALGLDIFGTIAINGVENASAPNTGNFSITLSNLATLTVTPGTYPNMPPAPGNLCVIAYIPDASNSGDPGWASAAAGQSGTFTVVVSAVTTDRIEGTFSGTLYDNAGNGSNTKAVTNGEFSVPK